MRPLNSASLPFDTLRATGFRATVRGELVES
jgi:hypothetical protein